MKETTTMDGFYKGRTIFVTGATGFMGKVLIEKMLRCLPSIERIYILSRAKRGLSPEERLKKMFQIPLFECLRQRNPDCFKKVTPIIGELSSEDLGMTEMDQRRLTNEVSIVFHFAATLRLEANVKDAVMQNTVGTKVLLDMCLKMKRLISFVHLSTAFCHCDVDVLEEKIYPPTKDPYEVMELIKKNDYKTIATMEKDLMEPHPNSYTFSKRLAETVVGDMNSKIPAIIIRPSIVIPSLKEPIPGWVDSLNGPIGIMAASGKGVLRTMMCDGNNHAEVVPVDIAINGTLIAAKYRGEMGPTDEIPVRNATSSKDMVNYTWGEVLDNGRQIISKYPFEWTIWYPGGNIRTNLFVHKLIVLLFHKIPAYFIDFLLLIFLQKRFMVRVQEKISDGLEVLQYFTMRKWTFRNTKGMNLLKYLSPEDQEIFFLHNVKYEIKEYLTYCLLGARQYCLKENPNSIPFWRKVIKVLYVIDRGLKLYIIYKLAYFALFLLGMPHLLTVAYWMGRA